MDFVSVTIPPPRGTIGELQQPQTWRTGCFSSQNVTKTRQAPSDVSIHASPRSIPSQIVVSATLLRNLNHSMSWKGSANSTSPVHRHGSCGDRRLREARIGTALPGSHSPISTREPKTNTSTSGQSGVRMTPNLNNIVGTSLGELRLQELEAAGGVMAAENSAAEAGRELQPTPVLGGSIVSSPRTPERAVLAPSATKRAGCTLGHFCCDSFLLECLKLPVQ